MASNDGMQTKEELVLESLRELILSGQIQSGIFLSQRRLASRVGAAVVTVRAALRQLENEGLIENVPRWGVRIPLETEESLKDRYYVRGVFETEAVRQIIKNRTLLDPAELYELAKECDRIVFDPKGSPKSFGILHYELHCKIVEMSGSPLLTKTFEKISLKSLFLWNAIHEWQHGDIHYIGDHEELIKTIFTKDESTALQTVRFHINRGLKNELNILHQQVSKT